MIDLTTILEAVIALAVAIITAFVIPWVKNKTTAQEREDLLVWVDIAVAAAQQLYHKLDGSERLEYALSMLEEKGFDANDAVVRDAVEAAVLKLHQQMKVPADAG
ncbi:MAG: holin [Oscillospiraceae bacterium]|nr:holin [Oscillospiraceae bacterium]